MNGRIDHWFLCDWFKTAGAAAESRRIKIFYYAISTQEPHGRGCAVGLRARGEPQCFWTLEAWVDAEHLR